MANLQINLCGLTLKNPTVLASGILGDSANALKRAADGGAGILTTKSITPEKKEGHKPPNIVSLKELGMINAMGLPNPGAENFSKEIEIFRKQSETPLIVSIAGKTVNDYLKVAEKIGNLGNVVELNLSCPNIEHGMEFGQSTELASEVTKKVKEIVNVPVGVKLGPNVGKIEEIAASCEKAGADFITAINTMPALAIDLEKEKPILTNKTGGLSGPALKPIALACVYKIYKTVKIPIIGLGGISSGKDAAEFFMAGASAVGIGTVIYTKGPNSFKIVCNELSEFMQEKGYANLNEMIGLAHKG